MLTTIKKLETHRKMYIISKRTVPFENIRSQKEWNFHFSFHFPLSHFPKRANTHTYPGLKNDFQYWRRIHRRNYKWTCSSLGDWKNSFCVSMSYVRESVCIGRKEIHETGGGHVDELKISIPSLNGTAYCAS